MEDGNGIDRKEYLRKLGYTPYEAERTAVRIGCMSPVLREALDRWMLTGRCPEQEYDGFTVAELVEQRGFTVPAAYLYLDWVLREPEAAKTALADMSDSIIRDHAAS